MIWLNPWAWLGMIAVMAPVLVHLLARRRATPLLFPTLRFIGASRPMLARRDRLSDLPILAIRVAIIAVAAAALAQPHFMSSGREQQLNRTLARSVIVDTSASMNRSLSAGGSAVDAARREAAELTKDTTRHHVQETPAPVRHLASEAAWLSTQPGRRELVVISDFQTGTLAVADVASVPVGIGVRFVHVGVPSSSAPLEVTSRTGTHETKARVTLPAAATNAEWTTRAREAAAPKFLTLLTADEDRALADAALDAARGMSPVASSDQSIAIVFPGFAGREELTGKATALAEPWMFDVLLALRQNTMLTAAGAQVADAEPLPVGPSFTTVTTGIEGRPLVVAAGDEPNAAGRRRLVLFTASGAGTVTSAALISGVLNAISPSARPSELDPSTIADETLKQWERSPGSAAPSSDDRSTSDGRWFWALALILLAIEAWMRRQRRQSPARETEAAHARVA